MDCVWRYDHDKTFEKCPLLSNPCVPDERDLRYATTGSNFTGLLPASLSLGRAKGSFIKWHTFLSGKPALWSDSFYLRNTQCMSVVKIFSFLGLVEDPELLIGEQN